MDLHVLAQTPPWDWPDDAGKTILEVLRDRRIVGPDRLLAAELAGEFVVINDEIADALLSILGSNDESGELRSTAAISLGPVLEHADMQEFEDPYDVPITKKMFRRIEESLRKLYADAGLAKEVRRAVLEASVRAPQRWHQGAVRAAYASGDEEWGLTAVFCMRYVRGFDDEIIEALDSDKPDVRYQAVCAAGAWGVAGAWPYIAGLLASPATEKPLLLAAIEAVPSIRPHEAWEAVGDLTDSDDEEIADAAQEALLMAEGFLDDDDEDDDDPF